MKKNEWNDVGRQIKDIVQSAIDSQDFTELNKTISNTISNAVGGAVQGVNEAAREIKEEFSNQTNIHGNPYQRRYRERYQDHPYANRQGQQVPSQQASRQQASRQMRSYKKPPGNALIVRHPKGEISAPIMALLGYLISGGTGMVLIVFLALALSARFFFSWTALFSFLFVCGLGMGIRGSKRWSLNSRFRRYAGILRDRMYCSIEELAGKTGRSVKYVRRDLKRMLHKGFFLEGHMDKQETCLMISNSTYDQYLKTQEEFEKSKSIEKEQTESANMDDIASETEKEYQAVLKEGNAYITHIRECNGRLPGVEISQKLDELEIVVDRIFEAAKKKRELVPELHKMLDYYLPTTQKLLDTYVELDAQPIAGDNIKETKKEIEKTIATICDAFDNFLDGLFRDQAWDIQSDISVLHTMLKQDGYIKSDFED